MLKKHTQIALCLTTTLTITNTYSNEYIINNASEENKEQIYDIVSKFRFPSILSKFTQAEFKQKYPNHDLIKTFKTKEAEYNFLKTEINNIDKNAEVFAIPKSLYQFIVYDYFADTIMVPKDYPKNGDFSPVTKYIDQFDLSKYATKNEEWGLTKACSRFMENHEIKNFFWKINDKAKDLYSTNKCEIGTIINKIFRAYTEENSANNKENPALLPANQNSAEQESKAWKTIMTPTLINMLIGKNNSEKRIIELEKYTENIITSESSNPNYVLYHGGNLDDINFNKALQEAICFSDGLGSGCLFDVYASAFALSGYSKKLYILELDRVKLLRGEYPIFIPPAHHLLSGAGNRELFHVRTKVVKAVLKENTLDESDTIDEGDTIDESTLSINGDIKPFVAGYKLTETPEFFTTPNPQRFKDGYEYISEGEFDKTGAEKLIDMIKTITEVPETEIF